MTPENKVKKDIKALLNRYNCYYFMPVQNGMGKPGVDFHCTVPPSGIALLIEAKAPGRKATARQRQTMAENEMAGGHSFLCDGNMEELEDCILKLMILYAQ